MKANNPHIPIIILTGFLGSGKTTLLNILMARSEFANSAIVVNEFGEIGLDHLLVAAAADNIVLLDSGCLCCAMSGTLSETLADLYHRRARAEIPPFERVIIETSGLADPASIIRLVLRDSLISFSFRLELLICTMDASFGLSQLSMHHEAIEQLAVADRVVVTKTDLTGDRGSGALLTEIRRINPFATIHWGGQEIIKSFCFEKSAGSPRPAWASMLDEKPLDGHGHRHTPDVTSHSFWLDQPVTWSGIAAWTGIMGRRYGSALLRCKGLLDLGTGGPVLIQGVQTMFDVTRLGAWSTEDHRSRIIVIGRGLRFETIAASLKWLHAPEGTHPPGDFEYGLSAAE